MKRTIVVAGYGPGISAAVARKFGAEGYSVALVARRAGPLEEAVASLGAAGIRAQAFPADLAKAEGLSGLIAQIRGTLGPIGVLHWNAYSGAAGDLLGASLEELRTVYEVSVVGLVAAVQASLQDLKSERGAVLVTGGGFGLDDPKAAAAATRFGAMGLAIGKASQRKTVALLHHRLAGEGVYVGEVVVRGIVKGTAFDQGQATLDADTIAARFWELAQKRSEPSVHVL
jgi:short-subunit dehydrogenase